MEKRDLCKSGDTSTTAVAAAAVEINLPKLPPPCFWCDLTQEETYFCPVTSLGGSAVVLQLCFTDILRISLKICVYL